MFIAESAEMFAEGQRSTGRRNAARGDGQNSVNTNRT
jgi:hypothetical protein